MAEKPAPKPDDDTYSDEEVARRMDAIVRAMMGMKPNPRKSSAAKTKRRPDAEKRRP
jgi:hypothetical protein